MPQRLAFFNCTQKPSESITEFETRIRLTAKKTRYAEMTNLRLCKDTVFWPGMKSDIQDLCHSCGRCAQFQTQNSKEPMKSQPIPEYPWQFVSQDLCEFESGAYLITTDHFSDFIEVDELDNTLSSRPPPDALVPKSWIQTLPMCTLPTTVVSYPPSHQVETPKRPNQSSAMRAADEPSQLASPLSSPRLVLVLQPHSSGEKRTPRGKSSPVHPTPKRILLERLQP